VTQTRPCASGNSWKRFSLSDGHGAGGFELAPLNGLTDWLTYLLTYEVAWAETYLHTNWHLSPSSRLTTTDIGRKLGLCAMLIYDLGPHLTQFRVGRGLAPYQVAYLDPCSCLATIDLGRKLGAPPIFGEGLSPHITQSRLGWVLAIPPYQVAS